MNLSILYLFVFLAFATNSQSSIIGNILKDVDKAAKNVESAVTANAATKNSTTETASTPVTEVNEPQENISQTNYNDTVLEERFDSNETDVFIQTTTQSTTKKNPIKNAVDKALHGIDSAAKKIANSTTKMVQDFANKTANVTNKLKHEAKEVVTNVTDHLYHDAEKAMSILSNETEKTIHAVDEAVKKIGNTTGEVVHEVEKAFKNSTGGIMKDADNVAHIVGNVTGSVAAVAADVATSVGAMAENSAVALQHCYEELELGCFPNTSPWIGLLRPFPYPMSPQDIDAKIYLYTTNFPKDRASVTLRANISIEDTDFDPDRPYTAFITHGFASSGNVSWVEDLKDAYLEHRDANIFIVDWGKGASTWNYLQVAANTRIVGAELARFGKYLVNKLGLNASRIHMMGHSLGAHISSYMAKAIPGVGQITAFDPAQPGFEGCADEVHLTKNDANFVDVIHTNTRPVIPLLGFGMISPVGHIDYYMNGGLIQPGCVLPPLTSINITSIADLAKIPVEVISEWVGCSHGKAYLYYTEALLNNYCTFWGRYVGTVGTILDIASFGNVEKLLEKFTGCTLERCSPIGLENIEYPARGVFAGFTHATSPYCNNDPTISKKMKELRSAQLEKLQTGYVRPFFSG